MSPNLIQNIVDQADQAFWEKVFSMLDVDSGDLSPETTRALHEIQVKAVREFLALNGGDK